LTPIPLHTRVYTSHARTCLFRRQRTLQCDRPLRTSLGTVRAGGGGFGGVGWSRGQTANSPFSVRTRLANDQCGTYNTLPQSDGMHSFQTRASPFLLKHCALAQRRATLRPNERAINILPCTHTAIVLTRNPTSDTTSFGVLMCSSLQLLLCGLAVAESVILTDRSRPPRRHTQARWAGPRMCVSEVEKKLPYPIITHTRKKTAEGSNALRFARNI
jgi:hypothetical protein